MYERWRISEGGAPSVCGGVSSTMSRPAARNRTKLSGNKQHTDTAVLLLCGPAAAHHRCLPRRTRPSRRRRRSSRRPKCWTTSRPPCPRLHTTPVNGRKATTRAAQPLPEGRTGNGDVVSELVAVLDRQLAQRVWVVSTQQCKPSEPNESTNVLRTGQRAANGLAVEFQGDLALDILLLRCEKSKLGL